jgi:hypothetical protein
MISMNSMFGIENFVLSGLMQMIEYSNVVLHPTLVNNALSELEYDFDEQYTFRIEYIFLSGLD